MAKDEDRIIDAKVELVGQKSGIGWKGPVVVAVLAALGFLAAENWPRIAPLLSLYLNGSTARTDAPATAQPLPAPVPVQSAPVTTAPVAAPLASPAPANDQLAQLEALQAEARQLARALDGANVAIAQLKTRLDAIKPETIDALEQRLQAAEQRANSADARLAAAEKQMAELAEKRASNEALAAAQALALVRLRMAAQAGTAFASELQALERIDQADGELVQRLRDMSVRGAPLVSSLQTRFAPLVREALKLVTQNAAEGVWDRWVARVRSLVLLRRTGDVDGNEPDAILARAEMRLKGSDLSGALTELAKLQSPAREVFTSWVQDAENRLKLDAALAEFEARSLARLAGQ